MPQKKDEIKISQQEEEEKEEMVLVDDKPAGLALNLNNCNV